MKDGPSTAQSFVRDGYRNFVARIGTVGDKSAGGHYALRLLTPPELLNAYRSSWLAQKIVDIIPDDATRQWRSWNAEAEDITLVENEEKRLQLKEKLRAALKSARLFGMAAIYIAMEDTDENDVSEPIDLSKLGKNCIKHLTVIPAVSLTPGPVNTDPLSDYFGRHEFYQLHAPNARPVNSDSVFVQIHASRLILLYGKTLPEGGFINGVTHQSDSALQAVYDAIMKADAVTANIGSLIFESKVDVIKIQNLNRDIVLPGYEEALLKRFGLANMAKSNNAMLLLDGEEEYDRKNASFGSLPEIMDRFFQNVAGASDIPLTRLYGMSPGGLNSTGESDLKNYYDRVKSMQELEIDPQMSVFNDVLKISAYGAPKDEIFHDWRSLWQLSDKERTDIGKTVSDIGVALVSNNMVMPEAVSEAVTNALIEYSVLPGLENAIDEFGLMPPEPTPEEMAAMMPGGGRPAQKPRLVVKNDEDAEAKKRRDFWREYARIKGFDPEEIETVIKDYDPNQPRDDRGRWTRTGAGTGGGQEARSVQGAREYRATTKEAYTASAEAGKASHGDMALTVDVATEADVFFVSGNGMSAFAIKGTDLIGAVNHKDNPERGMAAEMFKVAEKYGREKGLEKLTLDCFEPLPGLYAKYGFKEDERVKFDWNYAPEGWTKELGEPDVVFMSKAL